MERAGRSAGANRVAVVGFAFRFPGPPGEGFWTALREGRDLLGTVPASRWPAESFYHPRRSEPGAAYTFACGSIGDVSGFDAAFFGLSPREAAQLDPQQRLLLELTWEAFESGGIRPSTLRGRRASVHIGFSGSDLSHRLAGDLGAVDAFSMTGVAGSVAANRLSYFFDLRGPSMAVDTACSSSLVAFHQACESILRGEAEFAVSGAVSLHLHPLPYVGFSKAGMLSRRGRCAPFDARADGYVRAEGAGIVLLKRLEDARAAGDRVFAVVAGSAVNCDGKTSALTVPSCEAQSALLRDAYARACIDPSEIDYVEAHGTGTAVGDPIEARALGETLGALRAAGAPLRIGSVKSNLGHLEAAAGMAGLMKAIYCLRDRVIPPSIHFRTPNPKIAFEAWNLRVVTENTPLEPDRRAVIGVNSFGFGGANAHVILESGDDWRSRPAPAPASEPAVPLVLSARSEEALRALAAATARWLGERRELSLHDIAWSAAFHRDLLEHRAVLQGGERDALARTLDAFARGGPSAAQHGVVAGRALAKPAGPVFVYCGNGAQWAGMGKRLLAEAPEFGAAIDAVDACLARHGGFSVRAALGAPDCAALLAATEFAQPMLFALQVGLTEALRAWGVTPAAVLGHSVGEIAAAWACGALSLEQATHVVCARSAAQGKTRGAGGMTALALGEAEARALLAASAAGRRLALAAVNSPASVTLAGALNDLEAFEAEPAVRALGFRRLGVEYAFHSPAMEPLEAQIRASLASLRPAAERLPFYSTVSGARMAGEALDAAYWWRNVREPVQFARAVGEAAAAGASLFVEIGPHPVLRAPLAECLRHADGETRVLASMTRSADDREALRARVFEVLVAGGALDLARHFSRPGRFVALPSYPWQRERLERPRSAEGGDPVERPLAHPLLGWRVPGSELEWECPLDTSLLPELDDHRVGGEAIFPAAGFAELALAAAEQAAAAPGAALEVRELEIRAPLVLEAQRSKSVRLHLDPADGRFTIKARARGSDDAWRLHATGRVDACPASPPAQPRPPLPSGEVIPEEAHYRMAAALGLDYGPAFRQVEELWREGGAVTARLKSAPAPLRGATPLLHPASLDAGFQLLLHAGEAQPGSAFIPVSVARLSLHRPRAGVRFARIEPRRRGRRSIVADCRLYDAEGALIAALEGVRFQAAQLKRTGAEITFIAERRFLKPLGASALVPPAARLAGVARERLHAAPRVMARQRYRDAVEPLLEAMLGAFAAEALGATGAVPAERQALGGWLRECAAGDAFPDAREIWRGLLRDYPDHAEEIVWLGQIGVRLPELLRGEAWSGPTPACPPSLSQALADVVAEALRALPARRRLRLLLVDASDSPGLQRMQAQLDPERCDCVVLGASDLDAPRLERTAELAEPFDLVVAEQGVAWASDPARVLAHLRGLIAADGAIALGAARLSRASALAREVLREAGCDSAPVGCERGAQDWSEALRQSGFVDCVALADTPAPDAAPCLYFACAPRPAPEAPAPRGTWLLLADSGGESAACALHLRAALEARGARVQTRVGPAGELDGFDVVVELRGLGTGLERQAGRCVSLARLLDACAPLSHPPRVWVVTARGHADASEAPIWGFARSAKNEYPQLALRLADLDAPPAPALAGALAEALLAGDDEDEIIVGPEGREVPRAQLVEPALLAGAEAQAPRAPGGAGAIARLEAGTPGQLKGLAWTPAALPAPGEGEVEIEVRAAGLNFRDVMYASGQLAEHALEQGFAGPTLGMELSGVVRAVGPRAGGLAPGDEVIAFAPASFATRALTRASAVVRKPADWSFEAAATVPVAFLTAYYSLRQLARLAEGERVLIHGAAGGVGIAAIQIAQMLGAEIFATAGSEPKRDFLRLLGVEHVYDSRTLGFADRVMADTFGEGVDVVLNSLAGEAMSRSLRVLKPFGRFLELGKRDFYEDTRIGLRPFAANIAYFGIDADQLMLRQPDLTRRLMEELMALFRQGRLKPLPYRAFAAAEALEAFRFMQQSRQIGKVVLGFDPPPAAQPAAVTPSPLRLGAKATYLVTGGLRGFGLRTAQWLAAKGARHLVLASLSGEPDEEGRAAIAALRGAGVHVRVAKCDVADRAALATLLVEIRAGMPPLRGVVHAAALIRDGLAHGLDAAQIEAVLAPKARGALLLDELTRGLPLDFFVLYGSATTLFGNPGQAAYVAANRGLEALASARRRAGEPALCVSWGPIGDAGYLARHPQVKDALEARLGGTALDASAALAVLERLLAADASGLAALRFDRGAPRLAAAAASPRLRALARRFATAERGGSEDVQRWLEELDDVRLAALCSEIVTKEVAQILCMAPERLDARQPFAELGLDSLMGVELMTAVEARFGVDIPVMALVESGSVERLVARVVRELRGGREARADDEVRLLVAKHEPQMPAAQVEALAAAIEAKRP